MAQAPIKKAFAIGLHWPAVGPFLFIAHHKEAYPKGNEDMSPNASLDGRMLGEDFDTSNSWRMYHGRTVPGFPAHPHRGFETVSIVREGYVDHADSLGAAARYGEGDVQWLTTGAGVMHSEMFPLVHTDKENPLELFQLWLNLPAASKMAPPAFKMLWADTIPQTSHTDEAGRTIHATNITGTPLFAGSEAASTTPPTDSWAADPNNGVRIVLLHMPPHAELTLPVIEEGIDRGLYAFESEGFTIAGQTAPGRIGLHLDGTHETTIVNGDAPTQLLLLEGRPIDEPVAQQGPFVMNSQVELLQTMRDFQQTQFGGWTWPSRDFVHPREAGRFARHDDGTRETPKG